MCQIDQVTTTMQAALSSGMDWDELWRLVKQNRRAGDPVASIIHSIDLKKNQVRFWVCHEISLRWSLFVPLFEWSHFGCGYNVFDCMWELFFSLLSFSPRYGFC